MLGIVGVALVVMWGARAVAAEPALAGRLLSFVAAALLLYQPVKSLSGTLSQVLTGLAAAERLFAIADEPAPPDEGREAGPLRASAGAGGRARHVPGRARGAARA